MTEVLTRAYSAIEVRAISDGRRTFSGIATTPTTDRVGDTILPMGVRFANPLALLHQHWHDRPIGSAVFGQPTGKGIAFDAEIPVIEEPPSLKERVDVAWGELKHKLIRFVSIGFRPLKHAYKDDGGIEYQEIEVIELSIVTIPALPDAVITSISKSMSASAPLSRDVIEHIRRFDPGASLPGAAVRLVQLHKDTEPALPGGAVRLVKPAS
jgi:hypothetical protein